jgi:anti-sigma factor RsiW
MNHNTIHERLSLLFDGRLSAPESEELRLHVESCPDCKKTLAAFSMVREGIRQAASYEVSPMFARNVVRTIRKLIEREAPEWIGADRIARRLVAALGLLSLLVIGVSTLGTEEIQAGPERYFTGEPLDSSVTRTLLQQDEISKDDVLIAAVVD